MIFNYIIYNGNLIPAEQAQIFLFNMSYFSSFGVYETVKIDQGRPFYLEEHLHRLLKSAKMLDIDLQVDVVTLKSWFDKLIAVDPNATWGLKILALGPEQSGEPPIIAMQANELATYPDELYQTGAKAIMFEGERLLPTCKSLNTLVNHLARQAATKAGVLEGLLHHNGHFTEGSRTNLFAIRDGQLFTPSRSQVLSGITREVILEVMQETDCPVMETNVVADPTLYDEFFISSTSMHVMPITQIDDQVIGNGEVGPITKLVMAQFETHYRHVMEASDS